jgi:hypothetical protein
MVRQTTHNTDMMVAIDRLTAEQAMVTIKLMLDVKVALITTTT